MSTQRAAESPSTVGAQGEGSSSEKIAAGKATGGAQPPIAPKRRPPLSNLTNQRLGSFGATSSMIPCTATRVLKAKQACSPSVTDSTLSDYVVPVLFNAKENMDMLSLPSPSGGLSISAEEPMSSSGSLTSPVGYFDENDSDAVDSVQRKKDSDFLVTEQIGAPVNAFKGDVLTDIETVANVANVDEDLKDPQLCAAYASDIYKHLRISETMISPSKDFMEKIQQDINPSMRSILVDWLVEVAEEYMLFPDTLYLTINYIDRYLSGNSINRQHLQLLGVACMMIAAKFEEICAPQVEVFCYITDNTYFKEEVLRMESAVLNYLNFEMSAPTTKCFLRRFVSVAQACKEASPLKFECMANYIAELSLLEYHMLRYAPSITAASSVFLANYILSPSRRPWNATLQHHTLYEPSHLRDCVQDLHKLCSNGHSAKLRAIRKKYSQHKYKFVAKKYCPPMVPPGYFCTVSSS